MQATIEAAEILVRCPDLDSVFRRAVELAREKLHIERCALFADRNGVLYGTYGTDAHGQTTDEHDNILRLEDAEWMPAFDSAAQYPCWQVFQGDHVASGNAKPEKIGYGWIVMTRVRSWGADSWGGVLFNDTAISGAEINQGQQEALAVYGTLLANIIERKRAEEQLRESERQYRQLFTELTSGFALHEIICDAAGKPVDYRFLEINPAFEKLTGLQRANVVGRTVFDVLPQTEPHWIERYGKVALTGKPAHFEDYSRELDRHYEVVAFCPRENQFAVMFTDVTTRMKAEEERRQIQIQMLQTQKLESLGLLAGGIAHDFNNLLMGVLGHADIALSDLPNDSPVCSSIGEIAGAARRAADLCRQLLAYSGKGKFAIQPLDLGAVVREMSQLLQISVSKKTTLKYDFAENVPALEADPSQVRQIIMNLVINASESLGDEGGVVSVAVSSMGCDDEYLTSTFVDDDLQPGTYVALEVSDNGCGMSKETRDQVFDPFFSTKFAGRGLGLAAVLGIVRGHRGAIRVYSEPGKGSTFKILLPASTVAAEPLEKPAKAQQTWSGAGTVLVIDDEEVVRSVSRRYLQRVGFHVLTASHGTEGIEVFRTHADEVVCVVLDLTMPGMTGIEVLRGLRRVREDVPIILSSGYNEQDVSQQFAGRRLAAFLQKPYTADELISKVCRTVKND